MVLTEKQKQALSLIGKLNKNRDKAAETLKVDPKVIDKRLSRMFKDFEELIDAMIEYYPVFARRLKFSEKEPYTKCRRLARLIKKGQSQCTRELFKS